MEKQIEHNWLFKHDPEKVWDYLTKPELIEQWLMKSDFVLELGHPFQFKTRALPQFGFDGNVYCQVLEIVPFQKLIYSWKGGPGDGSINLDSIVEWVLEPVENGTLLHLKHSGFKEVDITGFTMMNEGWFRNVNKINELLKG